MRRRRPESRKILPDPVFKDIQVAKFVNYIMLMVKKELQNLFSMDPWK